MHRGSRIVAPAIAPVMLLPDLGALIIAGFPLRCFSCSAGQWNGNTRYGFGPAMVIPSITFRLRFGM